MKISKRRLRKIIKEEVGNLLERSEETGPRRQRLINKWTDIYPHLVNSNKIQEGDNLLIVNGPKQRLYIVNNSDNNISFSTGVSTGRRGFGNTPDSSQTSTGLMYVADLVGRGGPENAVYVSKRLTDPVITIDTNEPSPRPGHKAEVLTRILVLKGGEAKNQNVFGRSIYIHGTNLEYTLGNPRSGGCVRVSNDAIMDLVDGRVSPETPVYVYSGGTEDTTFDEPSWMDDIERLASIPLQRGSELMHRFIDESDEYELSDSDEAGEEEIGTVDGVPATHEEIEDVLSRYPVEENA